MTLGSGKRLFTVTSLGMEIAWRFAWTNFLFLSIFNHPYPWTDAVGAFLIAAIFMAGPRGLGWRNIYPVLLQTVGLGFACLHIIYVFHGNGVGFWNLEWLSVAFANQPAPVWLAIVFQGSMALVFWIGGLNWARRKRTYGTMLGRFDLGLSAFLIMFVVKLMLRAKFEYIPPNDGSLMMMISFFTFGLPALSLARTHSNAVREYQAGFRRLGVVLTFAALAVLLSVGAITFFLPQLTATAELGYRALSTVAKPLGPVAIAILKFLFAPRKGPAQAPSKGGMGDTMETAAGGDAPWWADLIAQIVGWGGTILLVLAGLAVLLFFLYQVWKWLMSKTPRYQQPKGLRALLKQWLDGFKLIWQFFSEWLKNIIRRKSDPVTLYQGLVQWGRRCGLYLRKNETPREYGSRLSEAFPMASDDIMAIVSALETYVYAERKVEPSVMESVRSGWKRMGRPALWPLRVKVRFLYQV